MQTTPTCSIGSSPTITSTNPVIQKTQTTLVDTNQVSFRTYSYDQYSNRSGVYDYDYGIGAPGLLLRHSATSYVTGNGYETITGTSPSATHLPGLVAEQTVYDASANVLADTKYCYDQQTGVNCRAATSLGRLSDVSGFVDPGNSQRGNVETIARLVSGGAYVQTSAAYDSSGEVVSTTDGNGVATTYSYADNFSNGSTLNNPGLAPCPAGVYTGCWQFQVPCYSNCTSNAFVSRITNALQQAQADIDDYYLGEATTVTDVANNVSTTYTFSDSLDRLTKVSLPDGGSVRTHTQTPLIRSPLPPHSRERVMPSFAQRDFPRSAT